MTWNSRVVWSEGMFILPQHFQQADRHTEHLVRACVAPLRSHGWGVTELVIDRGDLMTGRFAVIRCSGVMEDGTPFSIPDDAPPPPPLELPPDTRDCVIHLTLPVTQPGAADVSLDGDGQTSARFAAHEAEVADSVGAAARARVQVARLRLGYALDTEPRVGRLSLGLARVVELRDRAVVLDETYIQPCLAVAAAPALNRFLDELNGLLQQRVAALAGRVSESGTRGVAEFADYLLLLALNRYQPLVAHLAGGGRLHPEDFYRVCVQAAGELATIFAAGRRAPAFPPYQHEDLRKSFAPVMSELRHALSMVIDPSAKSLNLRLTKYGFWYAALVDRTLLSSSTFVLAVRAAVPVETLQGTFPGQVKIGAAGQIDSLIASSSRGILLRPLPVAPRQLPYHAGKVYFELERNGAQWEAMRTSEGFAVHVAGHFPDIEMDLWAIREVAS